MQRNRIIPILTASLAAFAATASVASAATVTGTDSAERLVGTKAADSISALGGNDRVFALNGADVVTAGEGNDLVVGGRGDDTLSGEAGNDRLNARDGEADMISCGDGTDVANLDNADVISDATAEAPNGSCETVNRAEPKTRDANAVNEDLQQRAADILAKMRSNR